MCSGKEQLKRNLHRSSKGAPKRKEKMKKTIAILLVLVIGMVGVWAADATLDLSTTIDLVNRIAITDASTASFNFPTYASPTTGLQTYDDSSVSNLDFDPSAAFSSTSKSVGYIHYKTNNAKPVTVTMSGAALVNADNATLYIPYVLTVAAFSEGTTQVSGSDNSAVSIEPVDGTVKTATLFNENYSSLAGGTASRLLTISIPGTTDDYQAGDYSATVTFTLTAE